MCRPGEETITPDCVATTKKTAKRLIEIIKILTDLPNYLLISVIERTGLFSEDEGERSYSHSADTSFSDLDAVIKEKSANLAEIIVELILTNQVGDSPERIHGIKLATEELLRNLEALDQTKRYLIDPESLSVTDIEPQVNAEEISKQMKANMSELLQSILTH